MDGAGGGIGGECGVEAIAELRQSPAERKQTRQEDHAGQVKGVAGGVDAAVEGGGLFATEIDAGWGELEAGNRRR